MSLDNFHWTKMENVSYIEKFMLYNIHKETLCIIGLSNS